MAALLVWGLLPLFADPAAPARPAGSGPAEP
jgi:hypothetical protein